MVRWGSRETFLSTPSARRATVTRCSRELTEEFLSTPSARRATFSRHARRHPKVISIHALREEGDRRNTAIRRPSSNFYPRPPRGGRRRVRRNRPQDARISIHALREEGDARRRAGSRGFAISIHALREEGDQSRPHTRTGNEEFLSTPSARRATTAQLKKRQTVREFLSTPSARRATRGVAQAVEDSQFLSTPSARRATNRGRIREPETRNFYPRPPRGGRPPPSSKSARPSANFYPRPPRGGRPVVVGSDDLKCQFLSTPSARRATCGGGTQNQDIIISIHALREEGDTS